MKDLEELVVLYASADTLPALLQLQAEVDQAQVFSTNEEQDDVLTEALE